MIYTYTAAAADILYVMLYGFVRVHQMWIEYLHRSLREVILGLRLRSGMESLYRFVFTRDVYRVKVCLIIAPHLSRLQLTFPSTHLFFNSPKTYLRYWDH